MIEIIVSGLIMGFFGSFHCVSMCGGLMSLYFSSTKKIGVKFLIYHISRVVGYVLLGLMFGQIGYIINIIGLQKVISVASGVFLILLGLNYFFPIKFFSIKSDFLLSFFSDLQNYSSHSYYHYMLAGFSNAFLPCGFSSMAILFAMTSYSSIYGMIFMFFFGISTIPTIYIFTIFIQQISLLKYNIFRYTTPVLSFSVGLLLLLRAMNLGIPYISPDTKISKEHFNVSCHSVKNK